MSPPKDKFHWKKRVILLAWIMMAERVKQWEKELEAKGFDKGVEQGIEQGETKVLQRQLEKRFSVLPGWVLEKLSQASTTELENGAYGYLTPRH